MWHEHATWGKHKNGNLNFNGAVHTVNDVSFSKGIGTKAEVRKLRGIKLITAAQAHQADAKLLVCDTHVGQDDLQNKEDTGH